MRSYNSNLQAHHKFTFRPGAYAILIKGKKVLLTYQAGTQNEFQLPGGGVDPGESLISALHREVLEETGWRLQKPTKLLSYRRFVFMPDYNIWAEKICHIFWAKAVRKIANPTEPDHRAHLVSFADAQNCLANEIDKNILKEFSIRR